MPPCKHYRERLGKQLLAFYEVVSNTTPATSVQAKIRIQI